MHATRGVAMMRLVGPRKAERELRESNNVVFLCYLLIVLSFSMNFFTSHLD